MKYITYVVGLISLILIPWTASIANNDDVFTSQFPIEDCEFKTKGSNRYFILKPGRQIYLSNAECVTEGDCDELEEVWETVLHEKRTVYLEIDGETEAVKTRVLESVEMVDGELAEISRNFFAECKGAQDVYYFGEDVDIYEDGEIVSHEGAWLAGVNGAQPGIIFPGGAFLLGAKYFQELAPPDALDRAENVDMGLDIKVPAGEFENCVEVEDSTPLDPGEADIKVYCPGVGIVIDEDLELISIGKADDD